MSNYQNHNMQNIRIANENLEKDLYEIQNGIQYKSEMEIRSQALNEDYELEDSKDDDDSKKRNRRRSKNDNDGRNHKCQSCGKSYLSYPALYTHIKTKHETQGNTISKGRGRPKKDIGVTINSMKLLYNPATFDYFKHPERTGETTNVLECMQEVFENLYGKRRKDSHNKLKKYSSINNHRFFIKINETFQNPKTFEENAKCDEIFSFYIYKVSRIAKSETFIRVLQFVTLYRECLNLIYSDKARLKDSELDEFEYSELFNPEDVPDISNEFITEYLQTEMNLFDYNREEAIDLTQNFCQWLYDNNYTCSKLSLISNY